MLLKTDLEHLFQEYPQARRAFQQIVSWLCFRRISILFYVLALFTPFVRMQQEVWGDGGGLLKPNYHIGLEYLLFGWGSTYFWSWFSNILYFTILTNRAPKAVLFTLSVINVVLILQLTGFTEYTGKDFMGDYFYYHVSLQVGYVFWLCSYLFCSSDLFLKFIKKPFAKLEMNPLALFKGKNLFLVDAFVAFGTAYILAGLLPEFKRELGIPQGVLFGLAALECWVGVYSMWCFFWVKSFKPKLMRQLAFYNLCNCIITIGLLFFVPASLTFWGVLYFLGEVFIILKLATLEWKTAKSHV